MISPTPRELALEPAWIPHAFEDQQLTFVYVPEEEREKLVFLTDGQFRDNYARASAPAMEVSDEAGAAIEAPLHFIFHSSFCCSTLLARALSKRGTSTSLSEPNILVNLAGQPVSRPAELGTRLDLSLRLLARPFRMGESVIVKPSSFAHRLIEPIPGLRTSARAVLLYSDAKTFLASVIRRGLLGRINARKLYTSLVSWTPLEFGFSSSEIFEQTDLQVAGLAWLMQIAYFDELASRFGSDRLMVLDAADLLADPRTRLSRLQSFFALGLSEAEVGAIVEGPAFSRHSKSLERVYDRDARERDRDALIEIHSDEIAMVLGWLEAVADHLRINLKPRGPA